MPRSKSIARWIAFATAACFLNLDFSAAFGGKLQIAQAQAQNKRRVALFVFPKKRGDAQHAQVLATLMREQLALLDGIQMLSGSPDPERTIVQTAGPLVEEGIRALNTKDAARAEQSFAQAYELIVRDSGKLDRRLLARTLKGLGVAKVLGGKVGEGKKLIASSLLIWPDQQAPEYGYTMDVMNVFREVEREVAEGQPGGISILSEPEGAEVRVGGKVRGYTPVDVSDLAPGTHHVQVQLDGYGRASAFVDVQPGTDAMQSFALNPIPNASAFNSTIERLRKGIKSKKKAKSLMPALASVLSADGVIAVQINQRGNGYAIDGWYSAGGGTTKLKTRIASDADFLSNIQNFLGAAVGASPGVAPGELPLDAPPQTSVVTGGGGEGDIFIDPNDPIFKKKGGEEKAGVESEWWFWTIIGVAVVGLGVGGYFLFTSSDSGKGPVGNVVIDFSSAE